MGRPLYSRAFGTTPAVREPQTPSCEKWSYLNAFDPDSDEFFDGEDAVYEDFIDPVIPVLPLEDEDEDEEAEERDMLVVRMGAISPISSESSLSDNEEDPLAVRAQDPPHLVVDAFHGIDQMEEEEEPPVRVRLARRYASMEAGWGFSESRQPAQPRRQFATRTAIRTFPQQYDVSLPVPTPSAPIPVPAVSRRSAAVDERAFPSPSTPPRQTPAAHFPMSPPPTSTPRLYTWARNPSHSSSPSSSSPFTNPHARTSYTHLSPALIRIRDVTV
ncbi:hypothetical protein HD554DRAFT_2040680 [Boletus coccyginus]|nr:hypothetical protein HD554DRAFT_2040680 [Boletus coccyginus]